MLCVSVGVLASRIGHCTGQAWVLLAISKPHVWPKIAILGVFGASSLPKFLLYIGTWAVIAFTCQLKSPWWVEVVLTCFSNQWLLAVIAVIVYLASSDNIGHYAGPDERIGSCDRLFLAQVRGAILGNLLRAPQEYTLSICAQLTLTVGFRASEIWHSAAYARFAGGQHHVMYTFSSDSLENM